MNILKYINSFPIAFTSTHYQVFDGVTQDLKEGKVDSPESWDTLREEHPHFSIGQTREEWLEAAEGNIKKDGQDGGMIQRAENIVEVLKLQTAKALFSVGVGGAGLEYQIKKRLPELHLTCTEYAPGNVETLKKFFIECDQCEVFDILKGDWSSVAKDTLVLMYRVDPHFTDSEWRNVFERMHAANIETILFIPCTCLTVRQWLFRLHRRLTWFLSRTPVAFAGYVRTQKRFESFWNNLYTTDAHEYGGLRGFMLTRT